MTGILKRVVGGIGGTSVTISGARTSRASARSISTGRRCRDRHCWLGYLDYGDGADDDNHIGSGDVSGLYVTNMGTVTLTFTANSHSATSGSCSVSKDPLHPWP